MKFNSVLFIPFILSILILAFYTGHVLQENSLYKTLLITDSEVMEISTISQKADGYYEEASLSYEDQEYNLVESNCRLARDYYSEESQGYINLKSELNAGKHNDDRLVIIYAESLDYLSEMSLNLFEACEHFEVAVRYYDKYYNEIDYKDSDYEMGTSEIEMMNEKIREHDSNVRKYNELLADYRVELNKRLM